MTKNQGHAFLPNDLIFAILPWLPAKSLVRFRCVCKPWDSFIRGPRILQIRHRTTLTRRDDHLLFVCPHPSLLGIEISPPQVFLVQLPLQGHLDLTACTHILAMPNLMCCDLDVKFVNGLLCFYPKLFTSSYSSQQARVTTLIVNPTTRQSLTLPDDDSLDLESGRFSISTQFGYDPLQDKFKVLRFIDDGHSYELKIFTVGDSSWRNITGTTTVPFILWRRRYMLPLADNGFCVNGAIHWLDSTVVRAFDVGCEQFRDVPIPDGLGPSVVLAEIGGCLSLIHYNMDLDLVELCILKDYQNQVWVHDRIKLPSGFHMQEGFYKPLSRDCTGEIILLPYFAYKCLLRVHRCDMKKRSCRTVEVMQLPGFFSSELFAGGIQMFLYQESFRLL